MMNVSIGRDELIALCASIEFKGPAKSPPMYKNCFERKPFINGDHWRFTSGFLATATNEQLFEIYSFHSPTIKLL